MLKSMNGLFTRRPQIRSVVTNAVKEKKLPKVALKLFDKVEGDTVDDFVAGTKEMSAGKNVRGRSQVRRGTAGSLLFGAAATALTMGAMMVAAPATAAALAGLASATAVAAVVSYGAVLMGGNEQHQASVLDSMAQTVRATPEAVPRGGTVNNPTTLSLI